MLRADAAPAFFSADEAPGEELRVAVQLQRSSFSKRHPSSTLATPSEARYDRRALLQQLSAECLGELLLLTESFDSLSFVSAFHVSSSRRQRRRAAGRAAYLEWAMNSGLAGRICGKLLRLQDLRSSTRGKYSAYCTRCGSIARRRQVRRKVYGRTFPSDRNGSRCVLHV